MSNMTPERERCADNLRHAFAAVRLRKRLEAQRKELKRQQKRSKRCHFDTLDLRTHRLVPIRPHQKGCGSLNRSVGQQDMPDDTFTET
jgi:hypothetical protein